jgi:hypothetical protein
MIIHLMTETLAKVYLEQRDIKTIQAWNINFEISEKCSFFTDISDIKILQQNNN